MNWPCSQIAVTMAVEQDLLGVHAGARMDTELTVFHGLNDAQGSSLSPPVFGSGEKDPAPVLQPVPDVEAINAALATLDAGGVVRWAKDRFRGRIVLSSSFGAHSALMLHLVTQVIPDVPVLFIDTGYLFPETYRFAEELRERLGLNLVVYSPLMTAARQEALYGRLWDQGDEGIRRYLQLNKVEPLRRALADHGFELWMTGIRASQTEHRGLLRRVERQGAVLKVHPILDWTPSEVEAYFEAHDLPHHPLYARGYRSIGDWHSTWPVEPHEHERAGRALGVKKECGLHLPLNPAENSSLGSSGL